MNPDFYIENGFHVFTEAYHLKRGTCCGSSCRHCPFQYKNVALHNFELRKATFSFFKKQPLTDFFLSENITNFKAACEFVAHLPYKRPSENSAIAMLNERHGTCSTKHVALKKLADEQGFADDFQLCIGIYKMTAENTKGIGNVLAINGLAYLPEAHTYLKHRKRIFDFTTKNSNENTAFANDLLYEIVVDADKILTEKANLHRGFLKKWLTTQPELAHFSVSDIWQIREACIAALS
jgi:Family of unknown function (DUF5522)